MTCVFVVLAGAACSSGSPTGGAGGNAGGGTTGTGGLGGASSCGAAGTPTGGHQYCSYAQGTADGNYSYNLYTSGQGSACMTVYGVDGQFSATWTNPGDFLARVGLAFGSNKTYDQLGTISAEFAETKTGTAGYNYIGIYGWSVNPLHEYYIVDDWFGSRPVPGDLAGTISVDGDNYDVYTHTQTNQPAITGGNATFVQFFSVRQNARACGTISVSQHFAAWAGMGMQLGNMEEARIVVEVGGGGTGTIAFTTATMTAGN